MPVYVIESILTFSRTRNRFLVSWEGYPPSSNTWEPFESFNDKTFPLDFLGKLKSLGVVCSKCISVAKSSAQPPASACNCIKRSPSPVCKPGKRALDIMKQRQDNAEDFVGAIAAPCNMSQVTQASTHGIRTQPLRRSSRHPSNPSTTLQLEAPQEQHNIAHPSRPRSTPPPRVTTPCPTSQLLQPRSQSPPAAPRHKHREQSGGFTSTRSKLPSRLVPSPSCAPNPRTRTTSAASPASSERAKVSAAGKGKRLVSPSLHQISPRCAASGVTAPSTLRQLRLSQPIAQNLPSDPPAPRRMSPRRSASGGVSGVGFHHRVSTPGNVVSTVVNDILDLEVRQKKGFPPRRWYRVSWFPCGSRPDSWVDCEYMPKHLVMMFEKKNPQHAANVDAEIKRRKGGRPPTPKSSTLAENVSPYGRQDCTVQYEPEDPKKKAYTRYEVWRKRMGAQWFGHCEMCGDRLCCLEPSSWHCAHNVAWTRGGSHDVENRRVSCPKCNISTSTLNFDEQAELRRPSPATLAAYITAAATSWWTKMFW